MTDAPPSTHNNPPSDPELLLIRLQQDHSALIARKTALLEAEARVPVEIADDEIAGKAGDFIAQINAQLKASDARLAEERAPYDQMVATVRNFFHQVSDPLIAMKSRIETRLTAYQRAKAARLKAEAEQNRQREAEAARQAQQKADREAKEARDKLAKARREKAEAEKAERAAKRAREAAERDQLAAAEARRKGDADRAAALAAQAEAAEIKAETAETRAVAGHARSETLLDGADTAFAASQETRRDVAQHHAHVERAEAVIESAPAALTRTRGDLGSVQSLRRNWDFRVTDIDQVPRKYLVIDPAVVRLDITRSKGRVKIPGIEILDTTNVAVRGG